jgi:small-conductance mechanosensitive channel/CRP-like cAMP-binding protein
MVDMRVLLSGLGLEAILVALRLACLRTRLAPVPLVLPSAAILTWLLHAYLPASWVTSENKIWFDSVLQLSRGYAGLQLLFWLCLELPSPIRWWPHPPKILRDLAALSVGAVLSLVVVQEAAQINVVGLVTTSAILTAVIGLAAQEALKDLFAGIMLRVESPFEEGDYIDLGDGINGWVDSLTLLSTRLRHVHGALITMPNNEIWQKAMRKFSPKGPIAREIHIHLDRELPPNQATELLLQVAERSPLVLAKPEPQAIVYSYHDFGITYELEVWQEDPTDIGYDDLRGELLSQIWYSLERIGQRVPFPVREFKLREGPSQPEEAGNYTLNDKVNILRNSNLFSHLSEPQLKNLANLTRCIRFAEGEQIVSEDDKGDTLFQIVRGKVAVTKTLAGGEVRQLAQLDAPSIFGEMSVFNEEPRSATVKALEQCVLLEVERADLRPLIEHDPAVMEILAEIISKRRGELLKLTPESQLKQSNDLLHKMRRLFLGA